MKANKGGICTGSRYAGKEMFARRGFVGEEWLDKGMNIRNQNGCKEGTCGRRMRR